MPGQSLGQWDIPIPLVAPANSFIPVTLSSPWIILCWWRPLELNPILLTFLELEAEGRTLSHSPESPFWFPKPSVPITQSVCILRLLLCCVQCPGREDVSRVRDWAGKTKKLGMIGIAGHRFCLLQCRQACRCHRVLHGAP